jgi:hypothetical protein
MFLNFFLNFKFKLKKNAEPTINFASLLKSNL